MQSALIKGSLKTYFGLANKQLERYQLEFVRRAVVSQTDSLGT